ncbi:MerR family transcriptional regulator, partial [Jatrophihabitans sp.]|uniref:MerR family transcriptional regulator n=1 Tax=Jatrophihabitans sp. TaxID=1932789 RepID=UPI002EFC6117
MPDAVRDPDDATLLSVGAAAGRLGVAPATVRSWERRYGLGPGGRSHGGHRRYTEADLDRLLLMQELVNRGQAPAAAARVVLAEQGTSAAGTAAGPMIARPAGGRQRRPNQGGGPGGRVLAVPGATPEVRGLARAASRLDADAVTGQLGDLLVNRGVVHTWNLVLRPVLVSIGVRWVRAGVDVEHVLSEAVMDALRSYRAFLPRPVPGRPVLLACAPHEQHTLPLHALAAGLAERRVPLRLLGGRVPTAAVATAARRTGAGAIFLWRHCLEEHGTSSRSVPAYPGPIRSTGPLDPARPPGSAQLAVPAPLVHQAELTGPAPLTRPAELVDPAEPVDPGDLSQPGEPTEPDELAELIGLTRSRPARLLVVGGSAWHPVEQLPAGVRYVADLDT